MERGDVEILHEPFSQLMDFGSSTVGDIRTTSETNLIKEVMRFARKRRVFFKDTTDFYYPEVLRNQEFLSTGRHTFLIREPGAVISSHFAKNPEVTLPEIGFARLYEIYMAVTDASGAHPIVIDSDDLATSPHEIVEAYNESVGLPHRPHSLSWSAGEQPEWAKTSEWHAEVSGTSAFTPESSKYDQTPENNPRLADFLEKERPYYEFFRERAVKLTNS